MSGKEAQINEVAINLKLGQRLKKTFNLSRVPKTVQEFADLGTELVKSSGELKKYVKLIQEGKIVIGETDAKRGQTYVTTDGKKVNVMCGYDMLATSLLRGEGGIQASCFHCGRKMEIKIKNKKITSSSSPSIVYWLGDGPKGIPICDHQNFFPDRKHLEAWLKTNPKELGVALTIGQAVDLIKGQFKIKT
ncbi:hypothetical protein IH981_02995 [Patescibacteria group bacterium]|nr:hypothetical protein [Patescibacteria group bacterium]